MSEAVVAALCLPTALVGARILLRPLAEADASAVFAATERARHHLAPWMHWPSHHRTLGETRAAIRDAHARWQAGEQYSMGIFAHTNGQFLGNIALGYEERRIPSCDLAYWISPDTEGRGYVSEAVRIVVAFAFDHLGARRVAIYCDPRNERSARVAERAGFAYEGHLRQDALTPDGDIRDTLAFSMLPEDFERAKAAWNA